MKKRVKGVLLVFLCCFLWGCSIKQNKYGLDPKQPTTIKVWHYYNSAQLNAFDKLVEEFNETVGAKEGIIVEGHSQGDVNGLEESVMAAVNKEVGSQSAPNIFASYADTAFAIEKMGYLVDLDTYFTKEEQELYLDSFLEEGRIGPKKELKIFPVAKSTELFMLNKTDWDKFAFAAGVSLEMLETKEGLVQVAEAYYNWTDSLTPEVKDDGKAFYGRDAMANLFLIGAKELGYEIFQVENQKVTLNIKEEALHKIWDFYYLPYIKGYFTSIGKFRSDDLKIGEVLSYVGSTSSAIYFPKEVTLDSQTYPIDCEILPVPKFKEGKQVAVQQGAGMVVLKGEKKEEYASVLFLKWLTQKEQNIAFSCSSGYMPVRKDALDYDYFLEVTEKNNILLSEPMKQTFQKTFEFVTENELYTNKAFEGGVEARKVLEYHLADKAKKDREEITDRIQKGEEREAVIGEYATEENFLQWFYDFKKALEAQVKQ